MSLAIVLRVVAWGVAGLWAWKAVTAVVGLPRVANVLRPECNVAPIGMPRVVVVVPARDEAASIAKCVRSLLAQDYGNLAVIAVNDRSADGTGEIMESVAAESAGRLRVMHIRTLPEGWLGKTHALALAAGQGMEMGAEYLLFTDADVFFAASAVRRALVEAVRTGADHFVLAPTPVLKTAGEGMMLGFLQVLGLWAARPWKVADPEAKRDAIGIGAFNLLRVGAYEQLGGFEALRMQILEDLTLARRVKELGLRQGFAFGPGLVTLHWASGAMGVVKVMTKNLFAVFGFRPGMLLGACVGLAGLCLEPFVGLATAGMRVPGAVAVIAIVTLYGASWRVGRIPVWTVVGFPVSAVLFCYSMVRSMAVTLWDGGVTWRGTFYSLQELRKSVVGLR